MGKSEEKEAKRDKKDRSHHKEKKEHRDRDKERSRDNDRSKDKERKDRHRSRDEGSKDAKVEQPGTDRPRASVDTSAPERRDASGSRHTHKRDREERPGRVETGAAEPGEVHRQVAAAQEDQPLPGPPATTAGASSDAQRWEVRDTGNESSMSIEETNRLRLSLGLKPLSMTSQADEADKARRQQAEAKRLEEQKRLEGERLAARVKESKEKRQQEEKLRSVRGLGEAGDEGDDLMAWVDRSRRLEEERAKADRLAKMFQQQDEGNEEDSDEDEKPAARELEGLRVKHDADELNAGETMILTMADRNILDERGELAEDGDELENVLTAEQKRRDKARKEANPKAKPLFDEDGNRRGILDKYDETDEADGMEIDASGTAAARNQSKQDEIRQRLAAAQEHVLASVPASMDSKADFYTPDELANLSKPRQRKKRKMRKREADADEAEGEAAGLDIAALEAAAAAQGAQDHGSRRGVADRAAKAAEERAAEKQRKQERYDKALEKANYASLALQNGNFGGDDEDDDEGEADLTASLARARRAAQSRQEQGDGTAADEALRRRDALGGVASALNGPSGVSFTETGEFARNIQVVQPEEAAAQARAEEPTPMEEEEEAASPVPTPAPSQPPGDTRAGRWVSAGKEGPDDDEEDMDQEMVEAVLEAAAEEEKLVTREQRVGTGLAGALALLKERGELNAPVEWAGRTNDMRSDKIAQLADVYTGGRHTNRIDAHIEAALTRRDEFGRVMTPKEAFRALCYKFHGKDPSKNKKAKRIQKYEEDQRVKRAAASVQPASTTERLGSVKQATASSHLVLNGRAAGLPARHADPATAPTPVLGGGDTPLVGDKKVAAMLGLNKGKGAGSMPPPPSRQK